MKRLVIPVVFLGAVLIAALSLSLGSEKGGRLPVNQDKETVLLPFYVDDEVPPITLQNIRGEKETIDSSYKGPTLFTFWSSHCPECKTALTEIERFASENPELDTKYVSVGEVGKSVNDVMAELGLTFDPLHDLDSSAFRAWYATMPASYYVKDGRIIYFFPGRINETHLKALLTLKK